MRRDCARISSIRRASLFHSAAQDRASAEGWISRRSTMAPSDFETIFCATARTTDASIDCASLAAASRMSDGEVVARPHFRHRGERGYFEAHADRRNAETGHSCGPRQKLGHVFGSVDVEHQTGKAEYFRGQRLSIVPDPDARENCPDRSGSRCNWAACAPARWCRCRRWKAQRLARDARRRRAG